MVRSVAVIIGQPPRIADPVVVLDPGERSSDDAASTAHGGRRDRLADVLGPSRPASTMRPSARAARAPVVGSVPSQGRSSTRATCSPSRRSDGFAPSHLAVFDRVHLVEVGAALARLHRPTPRPRASRRARQDARRSAWALRGEDESGHVRTRFGCGGDIVLARQPAHLHERAREQLGELRGGIGGPHQGGADEHGIGAGELGGGTLGAGVNAALGDHDRGRAGRRATSSSWALRSIANVARSRALTPSTCAPRAIPRSSSGVMRLDEGVETEAGGDPQRDAPLARHRDL